MARKQKGLLPKIEILIVAVFALSFIVWAIPKCSSSVSLPNLENEIDSEDAETTVENTETPIPKPAEDTIQRVSTPQSQKPSTPNYNKLFITIKNLKMRKKPKLNGEVIATLPLFEEVYFLNEVTDSTYKINLGYETADEPWVKVMTKEGKKGWVYGAGVHYHKKKRSGVME